MMIDPNPFPEALINMINLNWVERGKGNTTLNIGGEMKGANKPTKGSRKLLERP